MGRATTEGVWDDVSCLLKQWARELKEKGGESMCSVELCEDVHRTGVSPDGPWAVVLHNTLSLKRFHPNRENRCSQSREGVTKKPESE